MKPHLVRYWLTAVIDEHLDEKVSDIDTPKHASWINQIEIWFSILVRKVFKRGNFSSNDDLVRQVLAFINYYNETMAEPLRWTYQGKAQQM